MRTRSLAQQRESTVLSHKNRLKMADAAIRLTGVIESSGHGTQKPPANGHSPPAGGGANSSVPREDELRSLFENVPFGVFRIAPDGKILMANAALVDLLGFDSLQALTARNFARGRHGGPADWISFKSRVTEAGEVVKHESIWTRCGGTPVFVRENVRVVRNGDGTIRYFEGTVDDITEQKRAEETLRIHGRAVAAASNGIFICDATQENMPIVYCNPALEDITGYSFAEIIGKRCLFWREAGRDDRASREIRAALAEGRDCRVTVRHKCKDGTPSWNELTLSPVRDAGGRVTHFVGVKTDITKRRAAERKVAERTQALRRINQRLRENQTQLVHSEKMASLGQLAAGIAHEINNPMGFIQSNLSTLADYIEVFKQIFGTYSALTDAIDASDADAAEAAVAAIETLRQKEDFGFVLEDVDLLLAESLTGAERVKEIVQNLKSFARIDEADMKDADVNEGLKATIRMLWNELKYKCTVTENLQPLPLIRCSPGRLNQVFMNLLVNAAHAIKETGEIVVTTSATDEHVLISISDTGVGIPAENIPKLFNPFYTTKPVGAGTGLGLSISYGIIKKHNGRIEVESEVGRGTTFTIYLPIGEEENG